MHHLGVGRAHAGIAAAIVVDEVEVIATDHLSALGGGRTHTWRILSPLPLPLGYEGIGKS
jgi:hypothetical protein